jgi:AraC-like DNA-binding protein
VVLGANVLLGAVPENSVKVTAIYLDTDYVIDQVFWQHSWRLQDRLDAQCFAAAMYPQPAQIVRLGERLGTLTPWLDELVLLSAGKELTTSFYRMQALWFSVAHVMAPLIDTSPVDDRPSVATHLRPTLPRERFFTPLRAEARKAAALLRDAPSEEWTLQRLGSEVHLSPSQLGRVFIDAYGKTPLTFLTMVRIEHLARLLRETDVPIEIAMRRVGWRSRGHAARLFRQYAGVTPTQYRLRNHEYRLLDRTTSE